MPTASNTYAEKIYSEHPNVFYALDEQADFASFYHPTNSYATSLSNSNPFNWTYTSATKTQFVNTDAPYGPIQSAYSAKITATATTMNLTSPSSSFVATSSAQEFTIGFWLYSNNASISSIKIEYLKNGTLVTATATATTSYGSWNYFSSTFTDTIATTGSAGQIKISITCGAVNGVGTYDYIINGVSVGHRPEEFNGTSSGVIGNKSDVASISQLSETYIASVKSYSYATKDYAAHYLMNGKLLAKNSSLPMVYGSGNCTVLSDNPSDAASLIVQGGGFMNEVNENTPMTLECWIRINNVSNISPERIIGPINSTDGVYVNGPFLMLKVGRFVSSHYVGEWFRPMLLDICVSQTNAYLLVNGKKVASIDYNPGDVTFLAKNDSGGYDQDWIAFYATANMPNIDLDCVAIYPYLTDESMALRRYIYGQGIEFDKSLDSAYNGETVFIDYSFSGNKNNYNYPELGKWESGIKNNISAFSNHIEPYQLTASALPDVKLGSTTYTSNNLVSDIYVMNYATPDVTNGNYINLIPTGGTITRTWSSVPSYLFIDSIAKITNDFRAIYGVFKSPGTGSSSDKILIKIENQSNGDYVKVSLNGTSLKYRAKIGSGSEITIGTDATVNTATAFTAGFDIQTLKTLTSANFSNFFGNINQLVVYIGGDYVGLDSGSFTTFAGNIYTTAILNGKTMTSTLAALFSGGIVATPVSTTLLSTYPTYGVILNIISGVAYLDIETRAFWQDYVPLSVLSKYVLNVDGTSSYDIDFAQINIDYPELNIFSSGSYVTTNALVKSYLTFQYISDGANKDASEYATTVSAPQNKSITPSGTDWKTKKYEFVNGTVVYMPDTLDSGKTIQDLALVLHIDMSIPGVINNPVKIKSLQIAPKSLDSNPSGDTAFKNGIGTKFGTTLYPTVQSSGIKTFDAHTNPYIINKETSQYLNLTNNSGVKLVGTIDTTDRSLLMKINQNTLSKFAISSMQMSVLWNEETFPTTAQKVLEIKDSAQTIRFYVINGNASNTRGKIYAKKFDGTTETDFTDIVYYWNGLYVKQPYLNIKEWGMLGIVFTKLSTFDGFAGELKLMSNMLVNNISYYQLNEYKRLLQSVDRTWNGISAAGAWSVWNTGGANAGPWSNLPIPSTTTFIPSIYPNKTYQIFTGTNKSIFDSDSATGKIRTHQYQYSVYQNQKMVSQILKPQ